MLLRRRPLLVTAALAVLPQSDASQGGLPRPVPRLIKRSEWAAAAQWRSRLDARQGFVVGAVEVLRRLDDGLVLLVREEPRSIGGEPAIQHVRLERRDAAGRVVWQQPVPGLPG